MANYIFNKDCELIENKENGFVIFNFKTLKILKVNETSFRILEHIRSCSDPIEVKTIKEFVSKSFEGFDSDKIDEQILSHIDELKKFDFIIDA